MSILKINVRAGGKLKNKNVQNTKWVENDYIIWRLWMWKITINKQIDRNDIDFADRSKGI